MASALGSSKLTARLTKRVSLATWSGSIGILLLSISSLTYLMGQVGWNFMGFLYGSSLFLGSVVLKQSELRPVPFSQMTAPHIVLLRDQQATPLQTRLRQRLTRYRYQQDSYLVEVFQSLFAEESELPLPVITSIREAEIEGAYALILEFASPKYPLGCWQKHHNRWMQLSGADLHLKITQPQIGRIDLALIAMPITY